MLAHKYVLHPDSRAKHVAALFEDVTLFVGLFEFCFKPANFSLQG